MDRDRERSKNEVPAQTTPMSTEEATIVATLLRFLHQCDQLAAEETKTPSAKDSRA